LHPIDLFLASGISLGLQRRLKWLSIVIFISQLLLDLLGFKLLFRLTVRLCFFFLFSLALPASSLKLLGILVDLFLALLRLDGALKPLAKTGFLPLQELLVCRCHLESDSEGLKGAALDRSI
jgi:hypothetical protein